MYSVVTRGLDDPRERWCGLACLTLCAIYVAIFAVLQLSSRRIDDVFFARRDAFLSQRLLQSRLPLDVPVAIASSVLLSRGWSVPEAWGVWSDGPHADLVVALPSNRATQSVLELWMVVMRPPLGVQNVRLRAGELVLGEWRLASPDAVLCVPLPAGAATQAGVLHVGIDIASPQMPLSGSDRRKLGVGLTRMELLSNPSQCEHEARARAG